MKAYEISLFILIFSMVAVAFNSVGFMDTTITPPVLDEGSQLDFNATATAERLSITTGIDTLDAVVQATLMLINGFTEFVEIITASTLYIDDFLTTEIFPEDAGELATLVARVIQLIHVVGLITFISGRDVS